MNKHAGFRPYKVREPGSTKAVVKELINQAGGVDAVALLLDRSTTSVQAYSDPNAEQGMSFDQVRRIALARRHATAAAEDLALLSGGVLLPLGSSGDEFMELTADGAEQCGALVAMVMRAAADGKICSQETKDILPVLDRALRCLVHARAKLVSEQGERE